MTAPDAAPGQRWIALRVALEGAGRTEGVDLDRVADVEIDPTSIVSPYAPGRVAVPIAPKPDDAAPHARFQSGGFAHPCEERGGIGAPPFAGDGRDTGIDAGFGEGEAFFVSEASSTTPSPTATATATAQPTATATATAQPTATATP